MVELGLVCFKLISFREKNNNNQQNKESYPQPTNSAPEPQTTTPPQNKEQSPEQGNSIPNRASVQNRQTLPKNQGAFPQNTKVHSPKTSKKPIRIIFLGWGFFPCSPSKMSQQNQVPPGTSKTGRFYPGFSTHFKPKCEFFEAKSCFLLSFPALRACPCNLCPASWSWSL